jgi:hypothetical protein
MPHPRRWNSMNAASMPYDPVLMVPAGQVMATSGIEDP